MARVQLVPKSTKPGESGAISPARIIDLSPSCPIGQHTCEEDRAKWTQHFVNGLALEDALTDLGYGIPEQAVWDLKDRRVGSRGFIGMIVEAAEQRSTVEYADPTALIESLKSWEHTIPPEVVNAYKARDIGTEALLGAIEPVEEESV
jgi:hypothetical protein